VACPTCGKGNMPQAMFCGGCGAALSWNARFRRSFGRYLPANFLPQARSVAAGFVFGTTLFLFAFGSLGMSTPGTIKVEPVWEVEKPQVSSFASPVAKQAFETISEAMPPANVSRKASQADLVRMGNLLLEAFSPAVDPEGWKSNRQALADSFKYLQSLEQTPDDLTEIPLKRSDVAIFLFRLMTDLFELAPSDTMVNKYTDLPRYHYMNLPVDVLESTGLRIAREDTVFGADDQVSLEWLSRLSTDLVKCCEKKLKQTVFPALETRR
jgi:hypothetical protein